MDERPDPRRYPNLARIWDAQHPSLSPLEEHRSDIQALALRIMHGAQEGSIVLTPIEHEAARLLGFLAPGSAVATVDGIIPLDEIPIILLTADGPT